MRDKLLSQSDQSVVYCTGGPGYGKSELLRSLSHVLQSQGVSTLRIIGVTSHEELMTGLERVSSSNYASAIPLLFVTTGDEFNLVEKNVAELQKYSRSMNARILIELHSEESILSLPKKPTYLVRPLTVRECMLATNHLLKVPSIATAHSEAVFESTSGVPARLRSVMTDYVLSARRERAEPLDAARWLTTQASNRLAQPMGRPAYKAESELRRLRTSAGQLLNEYKGLRLHGERPPIALYSKISAIFANLGSHRRQSRWANKGLADFRDIQVQAAAPEDLEAYIKLTAENLPPADRAAQLEALLSTSHDIPKHMLIIIRCEIAAARIYSKTPDLAIEPLLEALALCRQSPNLKKYLPMILNRLGTAKMIRGEYVLARSYLTDAARAVRSEPDDPTHLRISGNLGLLSLYEGDPSVSYHQLREHRISVGNARRYSEYISALLNESTCLTDLGKGLASERRARLAMSLTEMLADRMRLGYAHNNLGWSFFMACRGRSAKHHLSQALAVRLSINDVRGVADTHINLSRLHLLARDYDSARAHVEEANHRFKSLGWSEGEWDCQRVLVRAALQSQDYDEAKRRLDQIPVESSRLPIKDRAETLLLAMERSIWVGEHGAAQKLLTELDSIPAVGQVHPLAARRLLLGGFLAVSIGDYDSAHSDCSRAAERFRESERYDCLIEALTFMSILACRMGNPSAGLRYLSYVQNVTARLGAEIT